MKYQEPEMEIMKFEVGDVLTMSGGTGNIGEIPGPGDGSSDLGNVGN